MGNAAIAFTNLIDLSTTSIGCSNELPLTPADTYLRSGAYEHVLWRWFASGTATALIVDFGSQVAMDTIALMALTGEDPTIRIRISTVDATGVAGDAYDSGSLTGVLNSNYLEYVHLIASLMTGQYLRIDISEAGVDSIGAGRLFAGPRKEFGINFAPGWSRTPVRRSVDTEGDGGQVFIDRRRGYWRTDATFGFASATDRDDIIEAIDVITVNEGHIDMLWIKDVDSTNLPRDCIWGFQEGDKPVTLPFEIDDIFSTTYGVRQRL